MRKREWGTLSKFSQSGVTFVDRGVQAHQAPFASEPQSLTALAGQPIRRKRARSHTVCILCIVLSIIWIASAVPHFIWPMGNQARGIAASLFLSLVFCTLQLPDGVLVRPHPAFWRLIKGVSILYLAFLSFLLFQDVHDVQGWLQTMDPSISISEEKNYAMNCNLFIRGDPQSFFVNVKEKLDIFVLAHFFGWLVKALVIRDMWLLWTLSLFFEWMEITFRHILPNFWECWWDHLLLDVFGCNLFGIYIGMYLVQWLEMKNYNWSWRHMSKNSIEKAEEENGMHTAMAGNAEKSPLRNNPVWGGRDPGFALSSAWSMSFSSSTSSSPMASTGSSVCCTPVALERNNSAIASQTPPQTGKRSASLCVVKQKRFWRRCLENLTPNEWTCYQWPAILSSVEAFWGLLCFIMAATLLDLNVFFLKAELHLPPSHWLVVSRTVFFAFAAAAGTRDFYEFITEPVGRRLGLQGWLSFAIILTEVMLATRYREALPQGGPAPYYIKVIWTCIGAIVAICWLVLYWTTPSRSQTNKKRQDGDGRRISRRVAWTRLLTREWSTPPEEQAGLRSAIPRERKDV